MKIVTALFEAILVFILFALFATPFIIMDTLSANTSGSSTIAQSK